MNPKPITTPEAEALLKQVCMTGHFRRADSSVVWMGQHVAIIRQKGVSYYDRGSQWLPGSVELIDRHAEIYGLSHTSPKRLDSPVKKGGVTRAVGRLQRAEWNGLVRTAEYIEANYEKLRDAKRQKREAEEAEEARIAREKAESAARAKRLQDAAPALLAALERFLLLDPECHNATYPGEVMVCGQCAVCEGHAAVAQAKGGGDQKERP